MRQETKILKNGEAKILGISGSLRSGYLDTNIIRALPDTRDGLTRFLENYSKSRCANSELALITALWGAKQEGASIKCITLSNFRNSRNLNDDKAALYSLVKEADGLIISSPVYFGANSCLVQNFIEALNSNTVIQSFLPGKLFAGLAVGAKRNGGQESTLIYQLADMLNLGFLGVGNDTSTTCQYGGTVVAGNKGTMIKDEIGIETCIGAGSRIAQAVQIYIAGTSPKSDQCTRFDFWILQDQNNSVNSLIQPLVSLLAKNDISSSCYRICDYLLHACKACDRCPNQKDNDGAYKCRIANTKDEFKILQDSLMQADVIVPTLFSPVDRTNLVTVYQRFLERTRYLRRGDYMLSNRVVIPLIFTEIGRNEHLDLRLISSLIRHNTIMYKPLVGMLYKGQLMNLEKIVDDWKMAIKTSVRIVTGRYSLKKKAKKEKYIPLGY